ncbi:hypothetical protein Hanom_Chr10g00917651 [Helianthus anomalus]
MFLHKHIMFLNTFLRLVLLHKLLEKVKLYAINVFYYPTHLQDVPTQTYNIRTTFLRIIFLHKELENVEMELKSLSISHTEI